MLRPLGDDPETQSGDQKATAHRECQRQIVVRDDNRRWEYARKENVAE